MGAISPKEKYDQPKSNTFPMYDGVSVGVNPGKGWHPTLFKTEQNQEEMEYVYYPIFTQGVYH